MRFANGYILFVLFIIPVLFLFYLYVFERKKRDTESFADKKLVKKLSNVSIGHTKLKAFLVIISIIFVIFALARPQFGAKMVEVKRQGVEVVIAVDVSKSMLAQDMQPNRMERAKMLLGDLIHQLEGNRIGIVAFAGTAFWQCPLTLDIAGANLFLQIMDTNLIPLQGTAIGDAIRVAVKGFKKSKRKSKAIILITDGEDHKSKPIEAAREAAKEGIKIFTVGIGSVAGEPIPVEDENGKFLGYKKNRNGQIVMSRMDEGMLAKIALDTGGAYFNAEGGSLDTIGLIESIKGLRKDKLAEERNRQFEDRYQIFLILILLILLIEYFVRDTKRKM